MALFALYGWYGCSGKTERETIKPPRAEKIKKELTAHGQTRIDYYYWLQERENPKVLKHLEAENNYTKTVMKHTEQMRKKLYDEMVGRLKQTDTSIPYKLNGYYYYKRYETGKEYPVYCRKKDASEAKEEILLDADKTAKGHPFFDVSYLTVSPDNKWLAYGVDTVSRRKYTVYFKNLDTGEILGEKIPNTDEITAWANDNKTLFYVVKDDTLRPYKIKKHRLGEPVEKDAEVFHETDSTFNTIVYKSRSKKYIMICSYSTLSTEFRFLDADRPDDAFSVIQPRERKLEYLVDHLNDKFYIRTNLNAVNFRLMETPVAKPKKEDWVEVIPHREDVYLGGFLVFKNYLALVERKDGLVQTRVVKWTDKSSAYIDFGEETYSVFIPTQPDYGWSYQSFNPVTDTNVLRYRYSSLTTPKSVLDYHMDIGASKLMKEEEVVGDFKSSDYRAERHYAAARDGVRVPISLVYRKGLKKNGDNPLLLYGYGSYGSSIDPRFNPARLSLLDRGFVYAIAHIRGGQEMGRNWYENGKLLKKKNTFTDFIDCAEYLVKEKFTNPRKLFANGGSAGGLLMGAVTNMRPDLFKGVIADVPWMDVVTCMFDASIPLTTSEYDEWGNPENKEYYDYMLSYSPYDNIEAKDYPAILVTTGFHDSQVQYWDPAKYVAKLRELKTDNNRLIFQVDMAAGHGGASGRFRKYKEKALMYAFMFDLLGVLE
jgi:oligopeptidase B